MIRRVAAMFGGFGPEQIMELTMTDLFWWAEQADELAKEMKGK